MREIYIREIGVARSLPSQGETLSYLTSIMRSVLQSLSLSAIEVALQAMPTLDDDRGLRGYLDRYAQPSDGLPVEILDNLVPAIRSLVFRNYIPGWFEVTPGHQQTIVSALTDWVEYRNKRPSHGVLDAPTTSLWAGKTAALLQRILALDPGCLPIVSPSGLLCQFGDAAVRISTPLMISSDAFVIGKVVSRKGSWRIQGQLLSWTDAREITIDLSPANIFANEDLIRDKFRWTDVPLGPTTKSVINNIPVRQTSNFVGRRKELDKLIEWMKDAADSRTCLVYGDGGFGKTTLVLEFLNSLLEGSLDDRIPLPAIISFYTAKKTRWTVEGLVNFKGISDAMEDSVRELMYSLNQVLSKDWYKVEGRALIDKAAADLKEQGFTRDDILLVLDNTETLTAATKDAEELADFIVLASKRIGRIVITSRRRELLAAVPIKVSELPESEALILIQALGREYKAIAINQAGEPKLRSACTQLMNKPLLIDTLVRYIARSNSGIQEGLDQILKKTNDELLEFLYEDAWDRMNALVREVFMVLASLASPLDGKCVGDACKEIGVQHAEFQGGLSETYFASVVDHGDSYDLDIVDLAKEFFRQKKKRLPQDDSKRLENIAFLVDKLATERFEIQKNYLTDRVADAFRSEYSKAAKIAMIKKDNKSAIEFFELAVQEEPFNAALHERFASFLLRSGKAEQALPYARRATELDTHSADAWLTLGLVSYQLDDLESGDAAIEKATKYGKSDSLCLLRRAIARYHRVRRDPYNSSAPQVLKDAMGFLEKSFKSAVRTDPYFDKNYREAEKYRFLLRTLILKISRREATPGATASSLFPGA